jgi:hypothetical protein
MGPDVHPPQNHNGIPTWGAVWYSPVHVRIGVSAKVLQETFGLEGASRIIREQVSCVGPTEQGLDLARRTIPFTCQSGGFGKLPRRIRGPKKENPS